MKPKFFVAVPNMGNIRVELVTYLVEMAIKYGDKINIFFRSQNPVHINRNMIVEEFINSGAEYLLFLDDDMYPRNDLLEMVKYKKPIIQALTTFMPQERPVPLILKAAKNEKEFKLRVITQDELKEAKNGIIKVDGIGTGCVLIHKNVFKKIKKPYFVFEHDKDGKTKLSEDFYFSVKCKKSKIDMFVALEYSCGHMKVIDLHRMNEIILDVLKEYNVNPSKKT